MAADGACRTREWAAKVPSRSRASCWPADCIAGAVMKSSGQIRDEILEAAARLFARYGFKKTSVDDVAAAAHIGKGSVYLHFASKEELFSEVVRQASHRTLEALAAAVKGARSPGAKVRAFVATKRTAVARLAAEYHVRDGTILELLPAASAHRQADDAREHALLADVLREGNASGAFAVADPDRLATGIIACLTGLDTSSVVKRDDDAVCAGVDALAAVIVQGLAAVPHSPSTTDSSDVADLATPDEV
jgi:AcrR family transcriptional regulator